MDILNRNDNNPIQFNSIQFSSISFILQHIPDCESDILEEMWILVKTAPVGIL